ncbi:hypothetical protein Tco_0318228 [Tanacetum coccineum]
MGYTASNRCLMKYSVLHHVIDHPVPKVACTRFLLYQPVQSSTSVVQDAPSLVLYETSQDNHTKPSSEESSSQVAIPNNVHSVTLSPLTTSSNMDKIID